MANAAIRQCRGLGWPLSRIPCGSEDGGVGRFAKLGSGHIGHTEIDGEADEEQQDDHKESAQDENLSAFCPSRNFGD